jgi:hypothetical protein
MITVGRVWRNKSDAINVKIDRTSVLGNPFKMETESQRDEVCEKYEEYFNQQVANKNPVFMKELRRIYTLARTGDVNLQCWCAPKRCHGDTIKKYLDSYLSQLPEK